MDRKWIITGTVLLAAFMLFVLAGSLAPGQSRADATETFTCAGVTQIPQEECDALVALYMNTGGDTWYNSTGWLKTDEPCQWHGITCESTFVDEPWSVTRLHLEDNKLKGNLPTELGNLQNLRHLELSRNNLVGNIPPELGVLGKLQHLYLTDNQLTGDIPPELGNLASLHFLWLNNNLLTGAIPAELGKLESLLSLYLDDNDLEGGLPAELGDLSTVSRIFVDHNVGLAGSLPLTLSKLDDVEYFWFHQTYLCVPDDLQLSAWLTSIDHLRTSGIPCADGDPATLVITKTVVGEVPSSDWLFSGSGAIGDFSLDAAGATATYSLSAGVYSLSETEKDGYTSEVGCTDGQYVADGSVNITLEAGIRVGCVFTNTALPAHLTVIKKVAGHNSDEDWEFSGSEGLDDFKLPAAGGSEVFTLTAGTYAITETVQDGYTATVTCTDDSIGGSSVAVDLSPGEDVSCTFLNTCSCTASPATLIITKTVVGGAPNSGWAFAGTGSIGPFTMPANGGVTTFILEAGVYTITEAQTDEYIESATCTDGITDGGSATVTLGPGTTVGCTFQNTGAGALEMGGLRGMVFTDANGNAEPDSGEGIEDVLVTITHTTTAYTATTTTEVDGVFDFDNLPVGTYDIVVTPPVGYETAECEPVDVQLEQTAQVEPIAAHKVTMQDNKIWLPSILS